MDFFEPKELKKSQFQTICEIVKKISGINLREGKEALVKARLTKRLRALGFRDFDEYINYIQTKEGSAEITYMVDAITTNKTNFFREPAHFEFLRERVLKEITAKRLRIWSAACSSGEEPYSIAITLLEAIQDISRWDVKILATDISLEMLRKAKLGVYPLEGLRDVPIPLRNKYFAPVDGGSCVVNDNVKNLIHFAYLNLMDSWPMRGPFDVIFCRNVMIYFSKETQQALVKRFYEILRPGGYLFVGHSEGLVSIKHQFKYVRPATYRK
jgi:chemotaxis protein methyltransferase CheR